MPITGYDLLYEGIDGSVPYRGLFNFSFWWYNIKMNLNMRCI